MRQDDRQLRAAASAGSRPVPAVDPSRGTRRGYSGALLQPNIAAGGTLALLVLATLAAQQGGWRLAALSLIGFGAGIALYHASFGFTAAWRRFILDGRSAGLRAQLVMLALAILAFFPLLARGEAFGLPLFGFVMPVGFALVLGAFLFGVGMQLGGGCGSGTLFTAGGGNARMLVTIAAFIAGSLIATADPLGWMEWPALEGRSLVEALGPPAAVVTALVAIGGVYLCVTRHEQARHGMLQPLAPSVAIDAVRGPWPLLAGAIALAAVNIATLLVAGRPWGITSAFALWGAKIANASGLDVARWPYWLGNESLTASLFADVTSIMNLGLMLGALVAAAAAGKFAPSLSVPWRSLAAAVAGGLLMGIGARLATGCNIGAFFSGIVSGSLHGLVWLAAAVPGNIIGVRLRPLFGLDR